MPVDVQTPVDSSPAAEAPVIENWTAAQRQDWLQTGKTPDAPKKYEAPAPSSTQPVAEEEEQSEATPEAKPKTEPGTEPDKEEPKSGKAVEKRISQLTRARREAERRADEAEQRLREYQATKPAEARPGTAATAPNGQRPAMPKIGEFDSVEAYDTALSDYHEKLTEWKLDQRDKARLVAESEAAQAARSKAISESWDEKISRISKLPDYRELLENADENDLKLSQAVAEAMMDSESGGEIAYFFLKHPEEAARISRLSPLAAVREVGKIEAQILSEPKAPQPKRITTAQKPPTELGSRATAPEDDVAEALKAGDFQAYLRLANARELKRG
jgi:hypothetical protein